MQDETPTQPPTPPPPAAPGPSAYPVRFNCEYPEQLSRLSTAFRIVLMIPLAFMVAILSGSAGGGGDAARDGASFSLGVLGSLVLAHWIVILLRKRPVNWIFDTIVHIERFAHRASTYFLLMRDTYPAFEGDWYATYEVDKPETLERWKVFVWKIITAIPHFLVLIALAFAVIAVTVIAWFAILFTGVYPRGMFGFVEGVIRWSARVFAYVMSLTDVYPPFSLE